MRLLSVNFHYFRSVKPESGIYPLTKQEFEKQVDEISRYYKFISQQELSEKIEKQRFDNNNYCLLTFDDGLKEQNDVFDILLRKGVPGVFYVSTDPIAKHIVLDVHKLHYIRSKIKDKDLFHRLDDFCFISNYTFNLDSLRAQYRYDNDLASKVKFYMNFVMTKDQKNLFISELFLEMVGNESDFSKKLYMSVNDIKKLSAHGCLGSHGASHSPLAQLEFESAKQDIEGSVSYLRTDIGVEGPLSISYPYGGPDAVSEKVADLCSDYGLSYGLTMFRGINEPSDFSNPFLLKRVDTNDAPGGKLRSVKYCI